MSASDSALDRVGGPLVIFGVVGLLVSAAAVPAVWATATASEGTVAVIEMHGTITTETATAAIEDLREARQNESIKAVTLDINSPGGVASGSEQLYLAVKRTQEVMPVVVSVTGVAASGSYYMSAPADNIYVSPASVVGSIGVRGVVPPQGTPNGEITTGPDKGSTSTTAEARRRVETLRRAFVGSVFEERGAELDLTREEISYAKVYSGARGVELGLADEVGGIDTAIDDAAQRAGLSDYETVRMESPTPNVLSQIGLNASGQRATTEMTFEYTGVDTVQYLMLHGQLHTPESAATIEVTPNGTN